MSSNLSIKRVCLFCEEVFTAKMYKTKYCSKECNSRHYKVLKRKKNIQDAEAEADSKIKEKAAPVISPTVHVITKELLTIQDLSTATNISIRTLFRIIKEPEFPQIKIGRSLRFQKDSALKYITEKYTVYERNASEKKNSKRNKR